MNYTCKYKYKLRTLEISNFMAVEHGKLKIPCINKNEEDLYYNPSEILGLYGPNGTGKSSMIKAFKLLKFVTQTDASTILPEYRETAGFIGVINDAAEEASFVFKFDIFIEQPFSEVGSLTYSFSIDEVDSDLRVKKEKISWNIDKGLKGEYKLNCKPSVYMVKNSLLPLLMNSDLDLDMDKCNVESILALWAAHDTRYSFLCKLFRTFVKSEKDPVGKLIKDFLWYLKHDFIVLSDYQYGNIRIGYNPNLLIFINDGQAHGLCVEHNGRIYYDKRLKEKSSEEIKDIISCYFENISNVLNALVPDLSLSVIQVDSDLYLKFVHGGVMIDYENESYGIRKLFYMVPFLIKVYKNNFFTLIVDEFDEGFFEYLLGDVLGAVADMGHGQLIFTAHNLIPAESLPKNSIWFTTNEADNAYKHITNLKIENNLRNIYFKELSGARKNNSEDLFCGIDSEKIANSFILK